MLARLVAGGRREARSPEEREVERPALAAVGEFDPEQFDIAAANTALRPLR